MHSNAWICIVAYHAYHCKVDSVKGKKRDQLSEVSSITEIDEALAISGIERLIKLEAEMNSVKKMWRKCEENVKKMWRNQSGGTF